MDSASDRVTGLFHNFEQIKFPAQLPELTNSIIIALFFLTVIVTRTVNNGKTTGLLHVRHTDQLKGIAIFFVILGHFWVHVTSVRPFPLLACDALSMFLLLSGFGLTISSGMHKIDFKSFFQKRIKRVMTPYWVATAIILALDYILLGKILHPQNIILTFLGLNITPELDHLDYVRWFVTFILAWYILFFLVQKSTRLSRNALTYLSLGLGFALIEYYLLRFGWYQFLSFPVGCILAFKIRQLNTRWEKDRKPLLCLAITALLVAIVYKMIMHSEQIWPHIVQTVPNIMLIFMEEGNSILLGLGLLVLIGYFGEKGIESKVLHLLGRYSYELFLIHGVFLIKYNPFLVYPEPLSTLIGFFLLLLFITVLSAGLSEVTRRAYKIYSQPAVLK